jgi:membrane-bound lytic murein transglycosylase A
LDLRARDGLQESKLEARRHGSRQLNAGSLHEASRLTPTRFTEVAGWADDDHAAAFAALLRSCQAAGANARPPCAAALMLGHGADRATARAFFETHTTPHRIEPSGEPGLVTGYYEPEVTGARAKGGGFQVPVYGRPDDLVPLTLDLMRARYNDRLTSMRQSQAGLVPYSTRAEIVAGALSGRGLELLYLDDAVELFFMQVQGSGRVLLREGGTTRLTYAGKNGHPYSSIGRLLVERGELAAADASMEAVKGWLRADPERGMRLMAENASYGFFRELDAEEGRDGPPGAQGVALTPGRSLAVDAAVHALGTPVFVTAPDLKTPDGAPFRRLMIAQDVGSAIRGPERGDIFWGCGAAAGTVAGTTKAAAKFIVLLPKR